MADAQRAALFELITEDELVTVCRDLVQIKTVNPPGNEAVAADYVAAYLQRAGYEISYVALEEGRVSTVGRLRGAGGQPALVFSGHLDVVPVGAQPWRFPPFAGQVAEGKVWGRGSSDLKGGLAAMLVAARALAASGLPLRGDLVLAATADEEAGMRGARSLVKADLFGPLLGIIICEPTGNTIGLAERGALWVELSTAGKTAHGSMPEYGHNAITMMMALLAELEACEFPHLRHPVLGHFTRSINTIQGGVKTNVIPDQCTVTVDMRTVPGQDHGAILRQIEELIDGLAERIPHFRAAVRTATDLPPVETATDHPLVGRFCEAAAAVLGEARHQTIRFATEASIYVPAWHAPTIIFGPGDPALAHQPDEYVEISALLAAARVYALAGAELLL